MRLLAPETGDPPDLAALDLADPGLYGDGEPHAVWRALRESDPVRWQPVPGRGGFWSVTRYAHARQVMMNHVTYSSSGGVFLNLLGRSEPASGEQFASTDPPRHGWIRGPLQHEMSAAAVARHVESLRCDVASMLDEAKNGPVDLMRAMANLPLAILGPLMGIPAGDWPRLARLVTMSVAEEDPDVQLPAGPEATLEQAHRELFGYLFDLVKAHLRAPRGDLIDVLMTMEIDGRRLRPGAVVANAYSIILGAGAAIPHVPAAALLELIRLNRYQECARRPDLIPELIEEALRWSTPAQHFMRIATRPARLGGVDIARGEAVVVWLGSANRDPAAFIDPDVFDPRRDPNRHLGFGAGRHYCIGNGIARLALRLVFQEMFSRFASFEPAGEVTHIRSTWLAGFKSVPVIATSRPSRRRLAVGRAAAAPAGGGGERHGGMG
jgi:cytochrome P450